MSLLAMDLQVNVTDHHDFLDKLRAFCLAQGWTIVDFQQNIKWQTGGFVAGDETYLAVESSGYGSQTLHFRFRAEADGGDPLHEWLQMGAIDPANTTVNTGTSTHPVQQNDWNSERFTSFIPSQMPRVWFFGNDKFVLAVAQFSTEFVQMLSFGTLELYDTSETEAIWAGYSNSSGTASSGKWYNFNNLNPFDREGDCIFYNGVKKSSGDHKINIKFSNTNAGSGGFGRYNKAVTKNSFTTLAPQLQPQIYIEDSTDGLWRRIGIFPIFRIDTTGMEIAKKIPLGVEEYLVFPNLKNPDRVKGIAVRIL